MMNASIAIKAMETLLPEEQHHYEKWQEALKSVTWEGRLEEVRPQMYVDGAHNPGAIRAFVETIQALSLKEKPVIVFSAVEDKEFDGMIAYLCANIPAKAYITTEVEDKRRVPAHILAEAFRKNTNQPVYEFTDVKDACQAAMDMQEGEEKIYCLGSLYLVGLVKEWLAGGK
jgi:dihydrofolate synthase/folylpolyglutamate synthase